MTDRGAGGARQTLRIVQLASHGDLKRGGAVQLVRLALGLAERGHQVVCAFNRPDTSVGDPDLTALRDAGVEVAGFELAVRGEKKRFRQWCKAGGFQIVHAHRDEALVFAWRALLGLDHPALLAGRGTNYPLKRFTWARTCFRSKKVKRVIAVAQAVKEALAASGVPRRKIDVVYGGVDENVFRPGLDGAAWRVQWGSGAGEPLIGNVAALVPKKGHAVFFRAASRVRAQLPRARFVCVGEGHPEKFLPLIEQLGLRGAVIFAGYLPDMPRVLAAFDVVVSSSEKGEGLNGAVREAMACGRPVVATDVAGNGELVRDQVNGRLVAPGDPQALANGILDLLRHPDVAARLGAEARETICREFTNVLRCRRVEEIYQSVLKGR